MSRLRGTIPFHPNLFMLSPIPQTSVWLNVIFTALNLNLNLNVSYTGQMHQGMKIYALISYIV